ncbi:MAG: hypothetical protein AB4050_01315 [Synechococcus sp.]
MLLESFWAKLAGNPLKKRRDEEVSKAAIERLLIMAIKKADRNGKSLYQQRIGGAQPGTEVEKLTF